LDRLRRRPLCGTKSLRRPTSRGSVQFGSSRRLFVRPQSIGYWLGQPIGDGSRQSKFTGRRIWSQLPNPAY
jgi:hypothetical protein